MSNELTGTLDRIEKGPEGTIIAWISGADYVVKDYVSPYLDQQSPGDKVDIEWGLGKTSKDAGTKYLLKIAPIGTKTKAPGKPGEKKKKGTEERNLDGVFRKTDGVNALITVGEKNSLYCLTPMVAEKIKEAASGQKVLFTIDQNSYLVRFALGEILSPEEIAKLPSINPPVKTAAQIKKENEEKLAQNPSFAQSGVTAPNEKKEAAGEVEEISTPPQPCRFCQAMIVFKIVKGTGVKFNLDGTPHSCDVDEGKTTAGQVQKDYGSTGPAPGTQGETTTPEPPTETPPAPAGKEVQQQTNNKGTSPSPAAPISPPPASRITIDCSISLGGYESLKCGISGDAMDRDALIAYLVDTLHLFGRRDEVAREAIDRYTRRIFA